jgi:hypothetical protein
MLKTYRPSTSITPYPDLIMDLIMFRLGSSGTLALQDMCQRLEALSSALMSTLLQSPSIIVDPCSAVQARYLSLRFGRSLGHGE